MYTLYTGLQIEPAGFFIDPRWPYLGPSPDGIIDSQAIVEIKYPYKHREEKLGLHNVDLQKNQGRIMLIFQNIITKGVCFKKLIIIFLSVDLVVIDVLADEIFQELMLDTLSKFYNHVFKDVLIAKRVFKGTDKLPVPYV